MVKIWGLDLKEMQWGKFKSSYMWNNEYHLRRTKFIVYQCAMIFTVVSESLGTAALSDYIDQQNYVEHWFPGASIYNDDFIGIFSYNIFVGVYVATIFGSAFFFDLFWPQRYEARGVKMAWKICSILAILFTLSAALGCTIILATRRAKITGANPEVVAARFHEVKPHEPLVYKHNGRGIASVCFLWPGFVATVASTFILWHSLAHIDKYGPFSTHVREHDTPAAAEMEREKFDAPPAGAGTDRPTTSTSAAAAASAAMYPEQKTGQPVPQPYSVDNRGQPAGSGTQWQASLGREEYPVGTNLDGSPRAQRDQV